MAASKSTVHVLGFAGSLRRSSHNRALLRAAKEMLPDGMTFEIFDLDDIPLYNADVEAAGTPQPVLRFRERLWAADSLFIATPEYNFSTTGVLKNALDWASRRQPDDVAPVDGKVVALAGAGGRMGTLRAQQHLREILLHNDMQVVTRPTLMIDRAWEKFRGGKLVDADARERLRALLQALLVWTRRFRDPVSQ